MKRQAPKASQSSSSLVSGVSPASPNPNNSQAHSTSSTSSTLAAALSFGALRFTSHNIKPAKLTLTPHHLFYLLSRVEELAIPIGPMSVRIENIHSESSPSNYVSFLNQTRRPKGRSDRDSIHSVSSVRSVMSSMSSFWSTFGLGSGNSSKSEKAKAAAEADLKYLYSAFTKIPCLRLSPDHRARLISGYEEFPFDTAVPLYAFKNLGSLEIIDVDFRQFFGWDRLAEQLRTLTVKRANVDDPMDLLTNIVLDDMDKRRRRSSKTHGSPTAAWTAPSPSLQRAELARSNSAPGSPIADVKFSTSASPQSASMVRGGSEGSQTHHTRTGSISPKRPTSSRQASNYRHVRGTSTKIKRSGSGSSNSSDQSVGPHRSGSASNLLSMTVLPPSKWRFLRHLSLADNSLTSLSFESLAPLANTLHSLDISSNLFTEVPDSLASLTALRALNLSNCMIESLHSLARNPLPAITALNLRANRLRSLAGVERLLSLERLDLRENKLADPTEIARLTGIPDIREIWVAYNPFTKSHGSYRVTIFNLFRRTPGFSDDIIIDANGPGYTERKQLQERIAEPERPPIMRAPEEDEISSPPLITSRGSIRKSQVEEDQPIVTKERPSPQRVQSEYPVGSTRRRKGPRRRIVDLSREESNPGAAQSNRPIITHMIPDSSADGLGVDFDQLSPRTQPDLPPFGLDGARSSAELPSKLNTAVANGSIDHTNPPPRGSREYDVNGEAYRKRLEALKTEMGQGWLSVLGDEGWDHNRNMNANGGTDFKEMNNIRPPITTTRSNSQVIVSGGRSLG
jgi:Leucine-rich repeat (LRR) protein